KAGAALKKMQPTDISAAGELSVDYKAECSPTEIVSAADHTASHILQSAFDNSALFKEYAYVDEEIKTSHTAKQAEKRIIVDPLDGSHEYLHGGSNWGITITQEDESGAIRSLIYLPKHDKLFAAERGMGAFMATPDN